MKKILTYMLAMATFTACSTDDNNEDGVDGPNVETPGVGDANTNPSVENLIVCNEGNWQSDNGQLSFYNGSTSTLTNQWFRKVNGMKLGDTPNDIVQINDTLIAIAINWSNIIQYIRPDGTAVGATENVPNNRRLVSDGRYLYVTSYAHECFGKKFTKGYVAKVDVETKQVVDAQEVGWEPEGICLYNGKLYVANSGGYAYQELHDYEQTIHVIDAESMRMLNTINTGCINLSTKMVAAGRYLCVGSSGDYYETPSRTVVIDCETGQSTAYNFPATSISTDGQLFYISGSSFSYTYEQTLSLKTINPQTKEVVEGIYNNIVSQKLTELEGAYDMYVSPYTKNFYFTYAGNNTEAGALYGYTKEGAEVFSPQKLYVNPAHILAIKP